ncbi:MAG: lipoate--protein ligase family protein [Leptolyngbya sp.]|nr:lipoate--protein ligase family protein [Candidatus Melainabacteria bacterium]
MKNWRLIDYEVYDAATNMAIDEAILNAHLAGQVPPTLRFYGWSPPAVSIGYGQKFPEKAASRVREKGFDIIRRPTGGRAVLHLDELTYSFVGSAATTSEVLLDKKILSSNIIKAYRQICAGLINGFRNLKVPVELGEGQNAPRQMHDCFTATTSADLHYQGKKIAGSAQLRRQNAVLQHGSILLCQEQDLMPELLFGDSKKNEPVESNSPKQTRHANLFEITNHAFSSEVLIDAFKLGFEEAFGITFESSALTAEEWLAVDVLTENEETAPTYKID